VSGEFYYTNSVHGHLEGRFIPFQLIGGSSAAKAALSRPMERMY